MKDVPRAWVPVWDEAVSKLIAPMTDEEIEERDIFRMDHGLAEMGNES